MIQKNHCFSLLPLYDTVILVNILFYLFIYLLIVKNSFI